MSVGGDRGENENEAEMKCPQGDEKGGRREGYEREEK